MQSGRRRRLAPPPALPEPDAAPPPPPLSRLRPGGGLGIAAAAGGRSASGSTPTSPGLALFAPPRSPLGRVRASQPAHRRVLAPARTRRAELEAVAATRRAKAGREAARAPGICEWRGAGREAGSSPSGYRSSRDPAPRASHRPPGRAPQLRVLGRRRELGITRKE
ncbi:serine/arginine repetitive matrix protein 1-like [Felis catus]|uniref:serine/arginine repetitive matrix protein 1-like n=1 Tax=Felis catus TaxID=9685 RepID=UPI001D19C2C4|nr:serine/arginine repetitive matrix protein 1-like [Felis catus]